MVTKYDRTNIGIFGYGSLLSEPGERIASHIIDRVSCPSPWPIEYARRSKGWGGGPTVVIHGTGRIVNGQVLILNVLSDRINETREWLREREGWPASPCIKEMKLAGLDHVLYCDLESNIARVELNPESLAQFAIESVRVKPERNGIRYLARNIERGVITPLSYAYRDEILRLTGASDLDEAEKNTLSHLKTGRLTV